jgi:hypothetical protein
VTEKTRDIASARKIFWNQRPMSFTSGFLHFGFDIVSGSCGRADVIVLLRTLTTSDMKDKAKKIGGKT